MQPKVALPNVTYRQLALPSVTQRYLALPSVTRVDFWMGHMHALPVKNNAEIELSVLRTPRKHHPLLPSTVAQRVS